MFQQSANYDNMQLPMQVPKHMANSNSIDMSTLPSPLVGMQNMNTNTNQGLSNFGSPTIQNPPLMVKNQIPIQQQQPQSAAPKQQLQQQLPQNYQQQQQQQPQYSLQHAAQQSSARKQQQQQRQVYPSQQLPTHPVQQLPTNQNQFGNAMSNQMPTNQFTNTNSSGAKLLPGLKATNEDWAILKEIYHETLSSPINLKDMTATLSDDDKRKVLGLAKQSKQLMVLCQSIIIPNFYFLTKQRDATKRIMYSELMLKQILEKLSLSGKYVADENLIHRIHDQIKKYLQFVKDQSSKIVKAQVQAQQVRAQQLQQQMEQAGNVPPKGTFNQIPAPNTTLTPSTLQSFQNRPVQDSFNTDSPQINLQMMNNVKGNNSMNAAGSLMVPTPSAIQPAGDGVKPAMNNLPANGSQLYSSMNAPPMQNIPAKPAVISSSASTPAQIKKPKRKPSKSMGKISNLNTPASSNTVASTPTSTTVVSNRTATGNVTGATTSAVPAAASPSNVNNVEVQAVLKVNNENVEKEEARFKAIDVARARRRMLASSGTQPSNSGSSPIASANPQLISGAAAYFLSTLCDTLGLESEEKAIISNANATAQDGTNGGISGFIRSKSNGGNGGKMLTPSAVLATPIGLNAKTPVAKYPSAFSPEEMRILPWTGKVSADCIANCFRAIGNLNLNPSPSSLNAAPSTSAGHKNSQTMSAGSTKSFVQLVQERQSKRKTMSILYGRGDDKKRGTDPDSPWNWNTKKQTDGLKVYPTPPEDADCAKKRKLVSVYPVRSENDSAAIKKIKTEDTDYDLLWDFDKV